MTYTAHNDLPHTSTYTNMQTNRHTKPILGPEDSPTGVSAPVPARLGAAPAARDLSLRLPASVAQDLGPQQLGRLTLPARRADHPNPCLRRIGRVAEDE